MSHPLPPDDNRKPNLRSQQGAVFIVMLVIMIMGAATILVSTFGKASLQNARDQKTAEALAQAKEALLGYATSVDLTSPCTNTNIVKCPRPGDLPCPDTNNDGTANASCSGNVIGRLPWKTLGLPDLRDGSGERLWYAVSVNFKKSPRTTCTNSNLSNCLDSDTRGTISVFSSNGAQLNDGGGSTGVVAVVIAPGDVLQRQDGLQQDRSGPDNGVAKNTASNYLDCAGTTPGVCNTEDNASFSEAPPFNGFIQGRIKDSNGNTVVNDQLLVITKQQIMPLLEKRVAAEVKNCLIEYANNNKGPSPNQGYYPFATDRTVNGSTIEYNDSDGLIFGHVPDMFFQQTCSNTGGSNCGTSSPSGGMDTTWGATCKLTNNNWWVNWKELVFFGYPNSLRPHNLGHNHACSNMTTCLVINPPSAAADKNFVVIVAGEKLPGQTRPSNNLSDYLEGNNATGATPFEQRPPTTTFNDTVVFQ